MVDASERERILALETELRGLTALLSEQRAADRQSNEQAYKQLLSQLTALATAADRYALVGPFEKVDARLAALEHTVTDLKAEVVPRAELQARLDGVSARQEQMQGLITKLDQALQRVSDTWTDEENDRRLAAADSDKRRNFIVGAVAAIAAVAAVLVSIVFNAGGRHTVVYYQPTPTTVTAPAGTGR